MLEIVHKKLKKGFVDVITDDELQAALVPYGDVIARLSTGPASMSEERSMKWATAKSWSGKHVGVISGEKIRGKWRIHIELCSLKETTLGTEREAIARIVLRDIAAWIDEKLALDDDAPADKYKLFLEYRHNKFSGELESSCFVPAGCRRSAVVDLAWELPT